MKRFAIVISLVALSLFVALPSFAQKNVIKVNPGALFLLTGSGAYERALTDKISLQLGGYYTGFKLDGAWLDGNYIGYKVWSVTPEVRFYPMPAKDAPRGLFIAPFARYRNASVDGQMGFNLPNGNRFDERGKVSVRSMGGGAILGYQGIIGRHFSMEVFAGPGLYTSKVQVQTEGTLTTEVQEQIDLINQQTNGLVDLIPNYRGPDFSGLGFRAGVTLGVAF